MCFSIIGYLWRKDSNLTRGVHAPSIALYIHISLFECFISWIAFLLIIKLCWLWLLECMCHSRKRPSRGKAAGRSSRGALFPRNAYTNVDEKTRTNKDGCKDGCSSRPCLYRAPPRLTMYYDRLAQRHALLSRMGSFVCIPLIACCPRANVIPYHKWSRAYSRCQKFRPLDPSIELSLLEKYVFRNETPEAY